KEHMQVYSKGTLAACTEWLTATWPKNKKEQGSMTSKNQLQAYGKVTLAEWT
ncbi:hypothetical protein NDU88_012141, partial [Pleurodeles waltl]